MMDFYLRDARLNRICVLESCDFYWDEPELKHMARMWKQGTSIERMAIHFNRDPDEVFLALFT